MNSHLKLAHDHGVQEALKKCGYASVQDVEKDVRELGLLEQPKQASAPAGGDAIAKLKAQLSK